MHSGFLPVDFCQILPRKTDLPMPACSKSVAWSSDRRHRVQRPLGQLVDTGYRGGELGSLYGIGTWGIVSVQSKL